MEEAREELHKLMEEEELKDAILLVYANKQVQAWAGLGTRLHCTCPSRLCHIGQLRQLLQLCLDMFHSPMPLSTLKVP